MNMVWHSQIQQPSGSASEVIKTLLAPLQLSANHQDSCNIIPRRKKIKAYLWYKWKVVNIIGFKKNNTVHQMTYLSQWVSRASHF